MVSQLRAKIITAVANKSVTERNVHVVSSGGGGGVALLGMSSDGRGSSPMVANLSL